MYTKPLGFQRLDGTQTATAVGLTVPNIGGVVPNRIVMRPEAGTIRWRDDGINPTATVGMPIIATNFNYIYEGDLNAIRFIQAGPGVTLNVLYYYASGYPAPEATRPGILRGETWIIPTGGFIKPVGFQQIATGDTTTVASLTIPTTINGTLPRQARFAMSLAATGFRWRDDGVDPSAAIGFPQAGFQSAWTYEGDLTALRFCNIVTNNVIDVLYYE